MSGATQFVGAGAVYPGLPLQTNIQQIIPSYLYLEYQDDDSLQAFVASYNEYATQFLLWFNTLNLPIYTGGIVSGPLLDWVGQGLYGQSRPNVTSGSKSSKDATNDAPTDTYATNSRKITINETSQTTSDDIYRRVITWNFYKGDGFVFNIQFLKRRILRFLNGTNGISQVIDNTFSVSVSLSGLSYTVVVNTTNTSIVAFLSSLVNSGACITPFQFTFSFSVSSGFSNDGGLLQVASAAGWPASTAGLAAGAVWSNGGVASVVPGVTPNPAAPPVFFGEVSSNQLLSLGGGNLPLSQQTPGSLQLWNNGGDINIS